jgi:hypothetical protein
MYVSVDDKGHFRVRETQDLAALKLVTSLTQTQLLEAFDGNSAPGFLANPDHAWISQDWLFAQGLPADAAWVLGFRKMMDYARTKGWMHPTFTAVRVHIEHTAAV